MGRATLCANGLTKNGKRIGRERWSKFAAADGHKVCPKCAEKKPVSAFGRSRATSDGCQVHCSACRSTKRPPDPRPPGFVPWSQRADSPGWVESASGCHVWMGSRTPSGYGQIRLGGRGRLVHCVRYEREIGPIPAGMQLDHFKCDNGRGGCCNPQHCRPVSARENSLRCNSVSSRNLAKTACPYGHEYTEANSYLSRDGYRRCRTCTLDGQRRSRRTGTQSPLNLDRMPR